MRTATSDPVHGLFYYLPGSNTPTIRVPMECMGKLHCLPIACSKYHALSQDATAFLAHPGNMTVEELIYLRFAHTPIRKLAKMSTQVTGLPRKLHFCKMTNIQCHVCHEAKSTSNDYPPKSNTKYKTEDHMGKDFKTIGGHCYCSIFMLAKSRYVILQLHCDLTDFKSMFKQVIAKAGFTPKTIRCDGAGKYTSQELINWFVS